MEVYICMVELSAVRSCGPPSGQQCRYGGEKGGRQVSYMAICVQWVLSAQASLKSRCAGDEVSYSRGCHEARKQHYPPSMGQRGETLDLYIDSPPIVHTQIVNRRLIKKRSSIR